jgi:hypothetical protein
MAKSQAVAHARRDGDDALAHRRVQHQSHHHLHKPERRVAEFVLHGCCELIVLRCNRDGGRVAARDFGGNVGPLRPNLKLLRCDLRDHLSHTEECLLLQALGRAHDEHPRMQLR